jgi:excisionase family DNA binding protein
VRVKEAAVRLEVSPATVYGLVAAGKLRCHRVGLGRGAIRISEEHVAEFLAHCTSKVSDEKPSAQMLRLRHIKVQ